MALKGDRHILYDDIKYFCNDVTERGVVLVHSGSGSSGLNMDDNTLNVVYLASNPSGLKPAGLLLNDFVNVDETRYHINFHKDEQRIGSKAHLLKKGWVVTNKVSGTPGAGDTAYLSSNGTIAPGQVNSGAPTVGKWKSKKDSDGYAVLEVDI